MNRILIAAASLATITLASSAYAQTGSNAKYCLQGGASDASATNCAFTTMAQCEADAKGKGGKCIENPKMTTGSGADMKKDMKK